MPLIADFDELGVVGFLDIVGTYPLEHLAEQIELPVGVDESAFALDPTSTVSGCAVSSVSPAPAIAPSKMRENLRVMAQSHSLFALR